MQIVRTEKRKRGIFGWLFLLVFIGFNLLMVAWMGLYFAEISPAIVEGSEAERTGASIGGAIGSGIILTFWAVGAVVLGILVLLSRGKKVITEEWPD